MAVALVAVLLVLAVGGAVFAFAGASGETSQKRIAAISRPQSEQGAGRDSAESNAARRKNVQAMLKDIEKKQAANKTVMTTRRRLDQAGLAGIRENEFWIASALLAAVAACICFMSGQSLLVTALAAFGAGFGLPRWVLGFLKARREKRFTNEFAGAIDVIVRSVKSGLPTSDALRIVATEFRDPVGGEFKRLIESMKLGVTLEQALKRMHESMPTIEVGFFTIVMTIQQKSGGNLSEALGNLAGRAARPQTPARQDQSDVVGSEGFGHDHRLAAARRHGHRLSHDAQLHSLLFTERVGKPVAGGLRHLDGPRRLRDAQDDQFQALRRVDVRYRDYRSAVRSALPGDGGRGDFGLSRPLSPWACRCLSAIRSAKRLKAVSERREELRARHHAALNAKRGQLARRSGRQRQADQADRRTLRYDQAGDSEGSQRKIWRAPGCAARRR